MAGLEASTTQKVLNGIGKDLAKKLPYISNRANYWAKTSLMLFPRRVFDTGFTRDNTRGEGKQLSKLRTNITFGTYNVPYLEFPFYGLGTSAKYGARKWLEVAREGFKKEFGLK